MPLQPPPRNINNQIVPHDHQGIVGDDVLIRRISGHHIVTDSGGNRRISSMAFRESSDGTGMSVDIERSIREAGLDPIAFVTSQEYPCSVQLIAGAVREIGLQVGYFPIPQNIHHGAVWGITTRSKRNQLRGLATWFVGAPGVQINDAA